MKRIFKGVDEMNREEFLGYLNKEFSLSSDCMKIIQNILYYIEEQNLFEHEQHSILSDLLDGIGLTEDEINMINLI